MHMLVHDVHVVLMDDLHILHVLDGVESLLFHLAWPRRDVSWVTASPGRLSHPPTPKSERHKNEV